MKNNIAAKTASAPKSAPKTQVSDYAKLTARLAGAQADGILGVTPAELQKFFGLVEYDEEIESATFSQFTGWSTEQERTAMYRAIGNWIRNTLKKQ